MAMNMEKALARKAELETKGNKVPYMKLEDGVNTIRILPPFGNRELPWVEFAVAYNVGPQGKQRSFTPSYQFGDSNCPLQKHIETLQRMGGAAAKAEIDKIRPKNKFHVFVIDRKDSAAGPKHLQLPPKVMADILTIMADPEYGDITDPVKGTDLTINYKKATSKSFPEYHINPKRNSSPLSDDPNLAKDWLARDLFEFHKLGRPADNDYVQAVLDGRIDEFFSDRKAETAELPNDDEQESSASQSAAPDVSFNYGANTTIETLPKVVSPFAGEKLFWVAVNGQAVQMSASKVGELVLAGQNPNIMNADQSGGWKTASDAGFRIERPQPPAPPVAPAVPSAPPVVQAPTVPVSPPPAAPPAVGGLPGSEAAALENTLREFQQSNQTSQVAMDLKAQLAK